MGKILVGLIVGALITAVVGYFLIQKAKSSSYDDGFSIGMAKGISEGIEEGRTQQKQYYDSVRIAEEKELIIATEEEKRNMPKPKPPRYDINYRMYGNEVGEEIKSIEK